MQDVRVLDVAGPRQGRHHRLPCHDASAGTSSVTTMVLPAARAPSRASSQPLRKRLKVVLYNPRAIFFTMPLALLAIGSELDPDSTRS